MLAGERQAVAMTEPDVAYREQLETELAREKAAWGEVPERTRVPLDCPAGRFNSEPHGGGVGTKDNRRRNAMATTASFRA